MRLPASAHRLQPWRIHEIAYDFRVLDVWALPTPGGPEDFPRLVQLMNSIDPSQSSSAVVRSLFAARQKLGDVLGWDGPETGVGSRVASLRDRLATDVRDEVRLPEFGALPAIPLYLTGDEFAAEVANRTVHGVLHLGWVQDGIDDYRGQLAILVKPNGLLGQAYVGAIGPFRHLLVYPAMMRAIELVWRAGTARGDTDIARA